METIKNTAKTILSHMGTIAFVGLLAYVLYCEFIRPAPSRQQINDALSEVASARHELSQARADLDTALLINGQISAGNTNFITQASDLFRDLNALNDTLKQKEQALGVRATKLEDQYKAKKIRLQEAKNIAL
ncbi:hypothetical protein [Fibrella forsythiae]|uniref:Uncharacterized protein n=1 Tax=Fibrella forsythiae TaxID=2817061 RepID=A0ABS3JAI9_9BACT|nr:hypothetical protein [Fibrella forsythiae]MBO0947013.1 hypothetical protein [Fibrella forsythiae]